MKKTKILIADDHVFIRMGLSLLLSNEPNLEIVGEACDGAETLSECLRLKPDLLVLDLMMPKMDGITVTRELHHHLPSTKIIILTSFAEAEGLASALRHGAGGIVLKSSAETELVEAIRDVLEGRMHLTAGLRNQLKISASAVSLTDRQEEILRSVMNGLSNADIARQHSLAEITVKKHLAAIFAKLGVSNRSEAVAVALRKQLLKA